MSKDLKLNPRCWPEGAQTYKSKHRPDIIWKMRAFALLSVNEMTFIQDIPRLLGNGLYANLGHAQGASAILLADGLRTNNLEGKVYSVDTFPLAKMIRQANKRITDFDVERWIELCPGTTDEFAERLKDLQFNFVFVDACHEYESVKQDIINWMPLVKPGGWMAFHDTNQDYSHRAIEETIAKEWTELKEYHIAIIRTFQKPI